MTLRNLAGAAILSASFAAIVAATVWKLGPIALAVWGGAVAVTLIIAKGLDLLLEP